MRLARLAGGMGYGQMRLGRNGYGQRCAAFIIGWSAP